MTLATLDLVRSTFTLQRPEGTSGDGYVDVARVAGAVAWLGGAEPIGAGAVVAVGQYRVWIWYRADVRAEWRLLDDTPSLRRVAGDPSTGRVLQITDFGDPDGARRVLELTCTEVH